MIITYIHEHVLCSIVHVTFLFNMTAISLVMDELLIFTQAFVFSMIICFEAFYYHKQNKINVREANTRPLTVGARTNEGSVINQKLLHVLLMFFDHVSQIFDN